MVDFVDLHYANMLSGRLENYRIRSTNPYKINFRCPICGDSQKSRSKSRGWLLENGETFHFYCHNCGASQTFQFFLKTTDNLLYNDYVSEKVMKKISGNTETTSTSTEEIDEKFRHTQAELKKHPLKKIKKISSLPITHPIHKYIKKRQIPSAQHYRMYFAPKFKTWINTIIPDKFDPKRIGKDEPRLVLPFLDENGFVFGVSARGFDPDGIRYITIMFQDRPKIFGLDKVNFNRTYFVVEGALDSMFLSNAVAMAGADGNTSGLKNADNAIFVFDAEPRNKEIHKRMEKIIKAGYRICIWPPTVPGKDINEMYLSGMHNVETIIRENTYKGLEADLKLAAWRKT